IDNDSFGNENLDKGDDSGKGDMNEIDDVSEDRNESKDNDGIENPDEGDDSDENDFLFGVPLFSNDDNGDEMDELGKHSRKTDDVNREKKKDKETLHSQPSHRNK